MSQRPVLLLIASGIAASVALAILPSALIAQPVQGGEVQSVEGDARLNDSERQRLAEAGPAVVKQFMVTMRTRFSAETVGELRQYIDPRYLKEHRLEEGAFPIQTVVTQNIHDNQPADDPRTMLAIVETEEAAREVFLFRTTLYEGKVYLLPLSPPDPASRVFKPWMLRVKLSPSVVENQTAGNWNIDFANGVSQVCHVRQDGSASVVEPLRSSAGKAVEQDGSVVITFADDRVERWTRVGDHRVVEHWFPASQYPSGAPVLGIARRIP